MKHGSKVLSVILAATMAVSVIPFNEVYAAETLQVEEYEASNDMTEECQHESVELVNVKDATCTETGYTGDKVCRVCNEIVEKGTTMNATGHTEVNDPAIVPTCTKAGKTAGSHCSVCGAVIKKQVVIPASHKKVNDPAIAPTCTKAGKTAGSHCSVCGKVIKAQKAVSATKKHTYTTTKVKKATTKKSGSITKKCTQCKKTVKTTIYYPKTIKLSRTSVTYNGKNQKPSVSIKNSKGKKVNSKYYSVSYKNNKNVGVATVTIKFKGNYSGTVKKTFKILPKSTAISKASSKIDGFSVKWKKQTSQTSGYQIQYSTSSKFKGAKTVKVSENTVTSTTIPKLKASKKYYVRIRTYKKVKVNGKTKKLYSVWSKKKSVKTKSGGTNLEEWQKKCPELWPGQDMQSRVAHAKYDLYTMTTYTDSKGKEYYGFYWVPAIGGPDLDNEWFCTKKIWEKYHGEIITIDLGDSQTSVCFKGVVIR